MSLRQTSCQRHCNFSYKFCCCKIVCLLLCRGLSGDSRKSSGRHHLLSHVGEPDDTSASVSALVISQVEKPTPNRDQKSPSNMLFSDKEGNQMHELVEQLPVPQNSSINSTAVSEDFELLMYNCVNYWATLLYQEMT